PSSVSETHIGPDLTERAGAVLTSVAGIQLYSTGRSLAEPPLIRALLP
ncbi:MAG: hypothetical protein JWQ56_1447, partial [Pseudarthrobacter sp.]|nr:hypothetical protein [Pseudarthrobacter sp.]